MTLCEAESFTGKFTFCLLIIRNFQPSHNWESFFIPHSKKIPSYYLRPIGPIRLISPIRFEIKIGFRFVVDSPAHQRLGRDGKQFLVAIKNIKIVKKLN